MSIEAREARQPWILLAPALTAIGLLLIVPLMFIVVYSFWLRSAAGADTPGFFLDNWTAALTDRFYRDILLNTLKIAAITTVACAMLGYPAAYFIARSQGNKLILLVLLMLPFWISYIIRTMSWINILGVSGALNSALMWVGIIDEPIQMLYNETTVILGLVHFLLPFMVLNIFVSLDGIDTNLEDAASLARRDALAGLPAGDAAAVAARTGGRRAALLRAGGGHLHHAASSLADRATRCSPTSSTRRSSGSSTGRSARRCRCCC